MFKLEMHHIHVPTSFSFCKGQKEKKSTSYVEGVSFSSRYTKGVPFLSEIASWDGGSTRKIFPKLTQESYVKNGIQKGKRERVGSPGEEPTT